MAREARRPVGRPKSEATEVIHIRLKPEQHAKLDAIAKEEGTTRTALVQIALARFLKKGL